MKRLLVPVMLVLVVGLVAVAGAAMYYVSQTQAVNKADSTKKSFVIPPGQAVATIANRLHEAGLINNARVFRLELKRWGLENKLQAGSFQVSPSMSMREVAETLSTGTNDLWITLPEGWRREEIAAYLSTQDLPAYNEAEFLAATATLEGKLFPETYLIPKQISSQAVVSLLTKTFNKKITTDLADEIEASDRSLDQIIVMASLVEREARTYDQMKEVAGILWRRLEVGMPLQVDATLQYAKGFDAQAKTWWSVPTSVDRERNNVFNTYLNPGLPPRPIANPGLNAIKATVQPNKTDNVFYIHAPDGKMYTAKTLDEHNRNIERYLR